MRLDPLKAYPYPVLREGSDDYIEGAFQAAIMPEIVGTKDGTILKISGSFQLSIEPLKTLISKGKAKYALTVDCRDTFTREYLEFSESSFEWEFAPGSLEGEFILSPCVVAKEPINKFKCDDIHEDFGSGPFKFSPGNILAQAEDQIHHISREFFKPVTSIFTFSQDEKVPDHSFAIELSGDKIAVLLCKSFRDLVLKARSQKKYLPVVFSSIYFPALVRVLSSLNEPDSEETYQGKIWYEVVMNQLQAKNLQPPILDPAATAQLMLGYPLKYLSVSFYQLEGE